jgi:hypothetical protein
MDTHYIPRCCPECAQGKHANCDGTAWDDAADTIGTCECDTGDCSRGYPAER